MNARLEEDRCDLVRLPHASHLGNQTTGSDLNIETENELSFLVSYFFSPVIATVAILLVNNCLYTNPFIHASIKSINP